MNQAAIQRMEKVYEADCQIGRVRLQRIAQVTQVEARTFLEMKRSQCAGETFADPPEVKLEPETPKPLFDLSPFEIELLRRGTQQRIIEPQEFLWSKSSFKFAHITDTHMGHNFSKLDWWLKAVDLIEKEECQFVCHSGDVTEGMNSRIPGHMYELEAIGSSAQLQLAHDRVNLLPCPVYAIDGNHDLWGHNNIGFDPCKELEQRMPGKFVYLGMHEADLKISNITIKMWHGEDGASYATSYRTQKFVEQLSGGEKPHILLAGHDHKEIAYTCRNVKVFGGGTLCGQTKWMRNKKLAAHVGFRIIEVWTNETGIERIKEEWIPFFT